MKRLIKPVLAGAGIMLLVSAILVQEPAAWVAPKEADALKDPVKNDAAATAAGKKLYIASCVVCHGAMGKGDGVASAALARKPADHSSWKIQSQTDGALFWKVTNGKSPMASYKNVFTDEQRWQLVNYIRELGKPSATVVTKKP